MSHPRTLQLGLVQHACGPDKAANLDTACNMIRRAAQRGAQLVATQELFTSTYFCQVEDETRFELAEPIPGPTSRRLCELAAELGVHLSASLFEKRAPGVYHNTSIMVGAHGEIVGRYRKMHIPDDPRFFEKYYFTPGDLGFQAQQLTFPPSPHSLHPSSSSPLEPADGLASAASTPAAPDATVAEAPPMRATTGMLICWDQWFPEAARLTALRGAELLFYPTAIGWYHGETDADRRQQKEAWQTVQKSHAIANGVFVAAVNRVGTEGELTFWGGSFVVDPGGVVIAEASASEPEVLLVECDLDRIEQLRRGWPFFRDRRIDAYQPLTRRLLD